MTAPRIAAIMELAGRQHGLVTTEHLTSVGVDSQAACRLTAAGVLVPTAWRGIRRVAGSPPNPRQDLLGAAWASGTGAAVSHRGAGWLWDLDGVPNLVLETSAPRGRSRRPRGVRLHHSTDLAPALVTTVDNIPVTEPTRTLIDLAGEVDSDTLEIAFDSALRQGLTSPQRAEAMLERMARPGRDGIGRLRALFERRRLVDGVTDSVFEARLVQVLRRGGLPEPDRQIELHDEEGFIGRFDLGYRPAMVLIEADSVRHHHSRPRFEGDRTRRTRAEALGWRVPCFTWHHLTRRPQWVVQRTADLLDATGWQWRPSSA